MKHALILDGGLQMNRVLAVLLIVAAVLVVVAQVQGGFPLVAVGLGNAVETLRGAAPLIICAFAVTGLMQVLIKPDTVRRWLGQEAGLRGVFAGAAAGALTPGGPYVYYPLALAIYRAGAGTGTIFAYIAGKAIWDVTRLPLELAFFGWKLTLVRVAVTLPVPLIVGYAAGRWFRAFTPAAAGGDGR